MIFRLQIFFMHQLPPDTSEQLIAGVIDNGDKHEVANISVKFCKNSQWPVGILRAWRKLIQEKIP
jgi:hypothetical protein